MYMYWILKYKIEEEPEYNSIDKKYTFILALDGDISFDPQALKMLIDLMRNSGHLAAACGRILPTRSGPVVWYQVGELNIFHFKTT